MTWRLLLDSRGLFELKKLVVFFIVGTLKI
jgi:hypothetical protein